MKTVALFAMYYLTPSMVVMALLLLRDQNG